MKVLDKAKLYLRKKDIEKANEERDDLIKSLTKSFFKDKTTKETIHLITEVTKAVNEQLNKALQSRVSDVEAINTYNNKK